jgi:hypothetical protein
MPNSSMLDGALLVGSLYVAQQLRGRAPLVLLAWTCRFRRLFLRWSAHRSRHCLPVRLSRSGPLASWAGRRHRSSRTWYTPCAARTRAGLIARQVVDVDDHSMSAVVALHIERPHAAGIFAKSIGSIGSLTRERPFIVSK